MSLGLGEGRCAWTQHQCFQGRWLGDSPGAGGQSESLRVLCGHLRGGGGGSGECATPLYPLAASQQVHGLHCGVPVCRRLAHVEDAEPQSATWRATLGASSFENIPGR